MTVWYQAETGTFLGAFEHAVERNSAGRFLDFLDESFTYGEIWQAAGELARGLQSLGVAKGDTVVGMLDNGPDPLSLWYACNFLGAVYVPINTALKGDFLRHVVSDSTTAVVVAEADLIGRFDSVLEGLPLVRHFIVRAGDSSSAAPGFVTGTLAGLRANDWLAPIKPTPTDLTSLVYTGGTTGPAKGCMISQNYVFNAGRLYLAATHRQADELNWSCLPLFHMNIINVSLMPTIMLGGTLAVSRRFSLSGFWGEIERSQARIVNLLGSMIALIAAAPDTPESIRCKGQVRAVIGAPFPEELANVWRDRFGIETAGGATYGLTEAVPITCLDVNEPAKPNSAGKASESFDVRIFDDNDQEQPTGTGGEIVIRPRSTNVMFSGYWQRPEATVETWRNGWFHTGDVGKFDEDGFLFFLDRKKDYLRRRGENISSAEMEAVYLQHSAITDVAVHAVPSELTEDDLKVTAVLAPDATLSAEELFDWSLERVPYFALPRYIEFRETLPLTHLGKPLKTVLREEGVTPRTWDRENAGVSFDKR